MANSLGRSIAEGEEVVIGREFLQPGHDASATRVFICEGGFGMHDFTAGNALFGHWKDGSGKGRLEGFMISREETETWQKAGAPVSLLGRLEGER